MITYQDITAAAQRIAGTVVRTPVIYSDAISRLVGADVWLKLDTLQATGAFKERGAANRLALLTAQERASGVVAMSAGNHAQAVARHASLLGIRAVIVMPAFHADNEGNPNCTLERRSRSAWCNPRRGGSACPRARRVAGIGVHSPL